MSCFFAPQRMVIIWIFITHFPAAYVYIFPALAWIQQATTASDSKYSGPGSHENERNWL